MRKSDQIKSEIDRLSSEVSEIQELSQNKKASAGVCCDQIKCDISEFLLGNHTEIDRAKSEAMQAAKSVFSHAHEKLQADVKVKIGLTYAPWEAADWASFDIENERPERSLTRLGAFCAKGQNGEFNFPAMFPILGGKNLLLRAEGTGRQKARKIRRKTGEQS